MHCKRKTTLETISGLVPKSGRLHHLKWILVEAVINVYTTCIVVAAIVVVVIGDAAIITITVGVAAIAAASATAGTGNTVEIHHIDVVVVTTTVVITSPVVVLGEKLMLADAVVQSVKYRYIGRNLIGVMVLQRVSKIGVRLEDAIVLQSVGCHRDHR